MAGYGGAASHAADGDEGDQNRRRGRVVAGHVLTVNSQDSSPGEPCPKSGQSRRQPGCNGAEVVVANVGAAAT